VGAIVIIFVLGHNNELSQRPTYGRLAAAPGYAVFYGRISTTVPFGTNLSISSISLFVTAIQPFVQSSHV
jgi:hypothetical protein